MRAVSVKGLDTPWSVITFGCWQIAPSGGWGDYATPEEADASVKAALEGGITAFDTAEGYGDGESERRLGKALGSKKNDVLIISKIWPDADLTRAAYEERLDGTLKALDRDYVDVYLVHWPGTYFNSPDKSRKLCEIMHALKESGKARTVGLSNFDATDLQLLGDRASAFTINQIPYNLLQREYEGRTLDACKQNKIGYMIYSPTARGLLAGRIDDAARKAPTRQEYYLYQEPYFSNSKPVREEVEAIAEELSTAPVNVSLAWVLAQDNVVTAVVGSKKPGQIREFAQAGDLILSPGHIQRLTEASGRFHAAGKTA
ncbi:aldo/keto reductase [Nitrospina gracilis]|uniref:aldo/keto reductase n=1 Tax=Nitrospina gracilis TaxID=35801 RepID=UPI001F383AC6|nr:aldo/keto reductase [Nitrospina gracilis]MCF8720081.1 aryl-alcohol dehydrogenase-like predicted oxidoreductase [Nitrospina gracilis Nb-211]